MSTAVRSVEDGGPLARASRSSVTSARPTSGPQLGHEREAHEPAREHERRQQHDPDGHEADRSQRREGRPSGQDQRLDRHPCPDRRRIRLGNDLQCAEEDAGEQRDRDGPDERIRRESRQRDHDPHRDREVPRPALPSHAAMVRARRARGRS